MARARSARPRRRRRKRRGAISNRPRTQRKLYEVVDVTPGSGVPLRDVLAAGAAVAQLLPNCCPDGWVFPSHPVASRPIPWPPPLSQNRAN